MAEDKLLEAIKGIYEELRGVEWGHSGTCDDESWRREERRYKWAIEKHITPILAKTASIKDDAECRRIVEEIFKELEAKFHGLYYSEITLKGFESSQIWLAIGKDIYEALKARTLKKLETKK